MGFINGLEALIAGAAAAAVVVALYFLKLRRRHYVVSSTLLWKRSVNDLAVNSPFQRLRANLLLFLQLLLIALAAFALARPVMNLRVGGGGDVIMLIDVSSSMNTTEEGVTRLELAKRAARSVIQRTPKTDSAMILTFADRCSVRQPFTRSKTDLERALDRIAPNEGPSNLEDALSVAVSMGRARGITSEEHEGQRIVIISDGGFGDPGKLKVEGHVTSTGIRIFTADKRSFEIPLQFVAVGGSTRNAGITHLDVRKVTARSAEVFVGIENFSEEAAEANLSLRDLGMDAKGDRLVSAVSISLGPKGGEDAKAARLFQVPELTDTLLAFTLDVGDDLPTDNTVWVPLRKPRPPSVLLVTDGNYFLEKALTPDVDAPYQFSVISPVDYPPGSRFDVTVFDGWAPPTLLPGSYLFIGASPPVEGVLPGEEVEYPLLLDWDHSHPLSRFVDFSGIRLVRARDYSLPIHASVVVEADKCPLIFAISELDTRIVGATFDLIDSKSRLNTDWPFRVSFPVFFSNAIEWLNPEAFSTAASLVQLGRPITFNLPRDVKKATITDPRGIAHAVEADKEQRIAFSKTLLPGPYLVQVAGKDDVWFAANLLSRRESDIAVRESFDWRGSPISGRDAAKETQREVWKYFAVVAIVLLMTEWYVYHRRGR